MTLNETEQKYFSHLFSLADTDRDGKVSGKEGAPFLRKSELSDKMLEKVWEVSDANVSGYLGPREFAIAMRLIAHAQNYISVSKKNGAPSEPEIKLENIKNVTSLPRFAGVMMPVMFPSTFTSEDIHKYDHLFLHADVNKDGFIDGIEAKNYFSKAKITQDKLAKIWELAEIDGDGKLNFSEFRVAMHLIYWSLKNEELPQAIPPSLISSSKTIPPAVNIPTAVPSGSQAFFSNPPTNAFANLPQQTQPLNSSSVNQNAYNQLGPQGLMYDANSYQGVANNDAQSQLYFQSAPNPMVNQMGFFQGGGMNNYPQQSQHASAGLQDQSQNFVAPPQKLGDPSLRPNVHQYALPGASFETRANFQNDLNQAMNNRKKN